MATAGSQLSEYQFRCSICLDVFTEPVSLPCGHNFCKACITDCFNSTASGLCQCPMCKEMFNTRPQLRVNCFISDMVDHFRKSVQVTEQQEREDDVPGEMLCDFCIDPKMKAIKSCLVCLTSSCETHLKPHRRVQTLKTHQLVEPLGNIQKRRAELLEAIERKQKAVQQKAEQSSRVTELQQEISELQQDISELQMTFTQ